MDEYCLLNWVLYDCGRGAAGEGGQGGGSESAICAGDTKGPTVAHSPRPPPTHAPHELILLHGVAKRDGGAGDSQEASKDGKVLQRASRHTTMDTKCINTVRVLAADVVQKANSGHPGAPMGCAPIAHALWSSVMNYDPSDPHWLNRDRFVLSNGHACALQYIMLHLTGYDVPMEQLQRFRQLNSITPGHPEVHMTPGVEVSTGPLGQGISNAVGLAIAESHLGAVFNRDGLNVVDHFTYVLCGDGCLQEGVSSEASSLAGHLGLGKLIVLYDDNSITIDGETSLSFSEDVLRRYEAYGWHVQVVEDGNTDLASLSAAIEAAKAETERPSLIKVRTTIGLGSAKEGTEAVHGAPLGAEDVAAVKAKLGLDPAQQFAVGDDVYAHYRAAADRARAARAAWEGVLAQYRERFPEQAAELERRFRGELPAGWEGVLPRWGPGDKADATRNTSGIVLNALAKAMPELVGGSADLTPSNKTALKGEADFQRASRHGRYLRFGVREHGMSAVANGIAAHGGLRPYVATFLVFAGYALGAMRLSALSHFPVTYVLTHDSIALGEDGPTHQPVETLLTLRAIPNMTVVRPADGNEVSGAYALALSNSRGPTAIALSRQNLPNLEGSSIEAVARGAYTVARRGPEGAPKLVLAASGSEVALALAAAEALAAEGVAVSVVSMPCWEAFDAQPREYQASVFPEGVPAVAVEAGSTRGWERYTHAAVGIDRFGTSAPGGVAYKEMGFTVENVVAKSRAVLDYFKDRPAPATITLPFR